MIEKSLRKTGGTPFYIENMRIEVQDGLMIPASVMNGMRRDALDLLLAKRGVAPSRDWLHGNVLPRDDETAAREGSAATPPRCAPRRRRMRCASLVWRPFTSRLKLRHRPDARHPAARVLGQRAAAIEMLLGKP